jgi:ABC-type transporter Mla subunit MlaD
MRLSANSRVGLLLIAAAALVMAYSLAGRPDPLRHQRTVWVQLPDAATLARFDRDVRVGGVNVGTVGRVEREGDHARVQLRLRSGAVGTIHADAWAQLRPHTLFDGTAFVELHPGSPSAPPLGGRTVRLAATRDSASLDAALRLFSPRLRADLPALTQDVRDVLRPDPVRALRRTGAAAPRLFRALTPALRAAQGPTRGELAGVVAGSARTVAALARAERDIGPALAAAVPTLRAVRTGADAPLDATLRALPATLRATATGGAALRRTVARLRPLAVELTPALEPLAGTLRELRPVLREAAPVLTAARPFAGELRALLTSAHTAGPRVTALLRALQPTVATLRHDVVPFLSSKTDSEATVYAGLAGTVSGAAGILAPVKSPQQNLGHAGLGHGWHMTPSVLAPTNPGCASFPAVLRDRLEALGLCAP